MIFNAVKTALIALLIQDVVLFENPDYIPFDFRLPELLVICQIVSFYYIFPLFVFLIAFFLFIFIGLCFVNGVASEFFVLT